MNSLVNRCGPTFVRNMAGRTGAPAAAIARAFAVVRDAWKLRDLWAEEYESALAGKKSAKEALDAAVSRGNTMLRQFERTVSK